MTTLRALCISLIVTVSANAQEFAPIRAYTLILLRFVALYCLFDTLQIIFVGALKGAGDMLFVVVNATVVSAAATLLGIFCEQRFAWHEHDWQLWGWWWVITGWIFTLGLVYSARFLQGRWREMRVIEPELEEAKETAAPLAMANAESSEV